MTRPAKKPIPQPRNAVIMIARTRHSVYLRDRRARRSKDKLARELRESV